MNATNANAKTLPLILRRAHAVGGMAAVLALSQGVGGKRVFVPKRPVGKNHPLAVAGEKVAAMLVEEFGGTWTEFPKGRAYIRFMIASEVIARKGSNNEIAVAADVTRERAKQLRRLIKRNPKGYTAAGRPRLKDDRQVDIEDFLRRAGK